jgi:hypothetical protein
VYVIWGLLLSLQPPFYPTEAEKKGMQISFHLIQSTAVKLKVKHVIETTYLELSTESQ